ncbi:MAG: 1,4-dihydroxy-2-naphthoate polyprenyltransferase [Thermoflavifilum sp.]|nr:1,4-dihydroxy-2-naphthoate polyprenyltransferase [Thermoflavifilum sp.]MCL6515137.1 1,4-dihydroxy-2-naphthoate polyprenyltransferase [Alicyclobacillus sp.]
MKQWKIWWRLLRPFTLTASITPALVGTGLALTEGRLRWDVFITFLVACILIQAATNMFNEYFDYRRGLDDAEMVGIAGTIVRDGIHPATVLRLAWVFMGVAVLLGLYICWHSSWWVALVGVLCMGVAYLYSGGPLPLAYTPFGEIAAAISMGPAIVLLAYFTQTGHLSGSAVAASIPVGLLIGAILLGNNIRDMDKDRAGGRRTVPILLGRQRVRSLYAGVMVVTYVLTIALVVSRLLTPWALLVLLTVPTAYMTAIRFYRYAEPVQLHPAVKGTAVLLFRFGALMFVGMAVSALLRHGV